MSSVMASNSSPVVLPVRSRWPLWLAFLIFFVPLVIAFVMYFYIRPDMRSNYGVLIEPQRDMPTDVTLKKLSGENFDLQSLRGKWILVQVANSQCDADCQIKMFYQRQIRTSTGKEQFRIERLVLLTDDGQPDPMLFLQFRGVHFVRARARDLRSWLPVDNLQKDSLQKGNLQKGNGQNHLQNEFQVSQQNDRQNILQVTAQDIQRQRHIFVIDPLGHVMLRFPDPLDPSKMRKDISRLLWASKVG